MLRTIYVGLAGMNAYSKGLDVISNNVANLNTTGFKAGIASFADVVYRNSSGATSASAGSGNAGAGVVAGADQRNFGQGEMRDSGNALDAALDGNGFFVLERDGQTYYTRAGSFEFDKDGFLIERSSGAQVMMSNSSMTRGALQIDPFRVHQPRATTVLSLRGTLSRTETNPKDVTVKVYDSSGGEHNLRVRFVRNTADPLAWTVEIASTAALGTPLATGTVRFNQDGTPATDNVPLDVTVTPTSVPAFTFRLDVGAANTYAGISSTVNVVPANSVVELARQDGLVLGTLQATNFDERGNLEVTYSNGEKVKIGRLVLASFDSGGDLDSLGNGLYVTKEGRNPVISAGMEFGLGRVSGGKLEMSNVELTEQFTNLIIIQRGYQASSQMTSVANEMMQQLMSMQDRR